MKGVIVVAALLAAACGAAPPQPVPEEVVTWHTLGTWSGRGNAQTGSFAGLTGSLRFYWKTQNVASENPGTFKLVLASAISGRAILSPVDEQGAGEGAVYAAEDPRVFHMLNESADLDWTVTVEEASFATLIRSP